MATDYDVIVIGSGPGGYIGAIRCAQLGFKTACVEKDKTLGGTCLNVGCIPSKALLESSHQYYKADHEFNEHGIDAKGLVLRLDKMLARKDGVVSKLTGGVDFLFKKNKIDRLNGMGKITAPGEVEVDGKKYTAKHIIIATGSVPSSLPGVTIDEKIVVSSTGALSFPEVPKKLVVIGGGYIGLELGSVWCRLGAQVEVIEYADRIVPGMDGAVSKELLRILKKQELTFRLGTAVKSVNVQGDQAVINVEKDGKSENIVADRVLMSIGRKPFVENLGLDTVGVQLDERGYVKVNENYATNVPGIYAIGDVIGGLMLAHKAEEEGVALAEILAGEAPKVNYNLVPGILYTHPEVASTGKTEEQLKKDGVKYKTGMFRLAANSRAISVGETDGFVKLITDADSDEILGAHIIAPNASEMIHELCLAMEYNATAEDVALTMHGHPTVSEAVKEAALSVHGRTLNA
jgi:dihydrolipoamide dehydrogenase